MSDAYEDALASLSHLDPGHPRPAVVDVLAAPENRRLLEYVALDPFGSHVFPGDIPDAPVDSFLEDLNTQLANTRPIHLWSYIPTCSYRCRFCQYPVVLVKGDPTVTRAKVDRWVDLNIREAQLWLDRVPNLRDAPIGEFNVFGGTPSLMSLDAVARLLDFYRGNFAFAPDTAIRFEGDPTTFTEPLLEFLLEQGCRKLSCGVQSFDDPVLRLSGREHEAVECRAFLANTRRLGFDWVTVDLMYGLLDQTVDSVRRDLDTVREYEVPGLVCTKLHLRSYADTRTGVAGDRPAAWQFAGYRDRLAAAGHHWPTLGEQYQMRDVLAGGLTAAGYREHPTMYFHRAGHAPEMWKAIMVDQDRQDAEVAIGLGGSSSCRRSEAMTEVNERRYIEAVEAGVLPLASATRFGPLATESRSIKMALSTLQPLRDDLHRERFEGRSLFDEPWGGAFAALQRRGLLTTDRDAGSVTLTSTGEVLVEAIMHTEFG
ncbi:radical SAM protein [Micromonospora sp. NPDC049240]|uniref:radical SAM protein n=1 Tax=Micromonospora sp. NPDC049240 TaxID=3155151 RepID=UPI0034044A40